MKRDVTAQAITGLDDEWIEEARTIKLARGRGLTRGLAAAACLVLVASGAWALQLDSDSGTGLQLYGETVEKTPMPISGGIAPHALRGIDEQERIEIVFFADASSKTEISVSAGTILPADAAGDEAGSDSCSVLEPTELLWVIEDGDPDQTYKLKAGKRTFLLRYDQDLMEWTLQEK